MSSHGRFRKDPHGEEKDGTMLRKAQFAHSWYPGDPERLRSEITSCTPHSEAPETVLGVIAPHAGMLYSGHVAGALYGRVKIPETVVVLSVNHRGLGERASIMSSGSWETPLGRVPIEEAAAETMKKFIPFLQEDSRAHAKEHSLELHLPFLQFRNPAFRLVPVCLQQLDLAECEQLGRGLSRMVRERDTGTLLVASSDMSHFEPETSAREKDKIAIQRMLALDPPGLFNTVKKNRISMCGVVPATVLLYSCLELAAKEAELVKYATSGEISHDFSSVVGYASLLVR
jgi:AmmeMemoRadiSam system protein B